MSSTSLRDPTPLEIAEAIAPGWERRRAFVEDVCAPVRRWMVEQLAPRPGDTVLELAAGAGDTGFEAARIIGERGRLLSTDLSPAMLDVARRRGAELGIDNADYRVMDAQRIELPDDAVDGVLCRLGYMLMPDPAAALRETRRVLRDGGRLVLAVWGAPERNPVFAAAGSALVARGHVPPPDPAAPGVFAMAAAERTTALLAQAGFGDVRTEEVPVRFSFGDVDEYLAVVMDTSGGLALALRGLSEGDLRGLRPLLEEAFGAFARSGGYEIPGSALAASAS